MKLSKDRIIGNRNSTAPSISGDGRYVVFESLSNNLDQVLYTSELYKSNIYVHDRQTNTTALVSRNYTGKLPNQNSGTPNISSDGQYIVFGSNAWDMLATPTGISDNHIYRVANPLR